MRKIIWAVAVMSTCVAAGVVSPCAYAANEPVWVSKEHTLKSSSETRSAVAKFGKLKIRWEDKTTTTKFEVECKKASGEVELKGGFPGKDQLTTLTFEECSLIKGAGGCKLTAGSVMAEELPGWSTELKLAPLADVFTGVRFSLALNGCTKGSFSKTWIFKGNLKATLKNESGKVKLTLPTLAGGAEPIETEGDEASLSGPGEFEEKTGTLAAEEATARWYSEAGERFAEGVRTNILIESVGNTTINFKVEGTEAEISCPVLEGEGWVENPTTGGAGLDLHEARYKKCSVPKPGGGCKVPLESFHEAANSALVYKGTTIFDRLIGTVGIVNLAEIKIEGCEKAVLNKTWTLRGAEESSGILAEFNNEKSTLKFGAVGITMNSEKGTLTAEDKVETETGKKIQVG
jgi:hypothetical protein